MDNTVKTERQKYKEKLEKELAKAAHAKHFVDSSEGQYVIEWLKTLASDLINQITNKRVEHLDYVEKRAQIDILRKLTQVLETQANETVISELNQRLNEANSEE